MWRFLISGNRGVEENLKLGERWVHACQWINDKVNQLKNLLANQKQLGDSHHTLNTWLGETEAALKKMEAEPAREIPKIMERIEQMKKIHYEIQKNSDKIMQLTLEAEKLDECELDGEAATLLIALETSQDRLDALKSILEMQAQRIRFSGFELNFTDVDVAESVEEDKENHLETKKRKVSSSFSDFDNLTAELNSWLDCWESLLDQSDTNVRSGSHSIESHLKLCAEAELDLQNRRPDFEKALDLGQKILQGIKNNKEKKQQEQKNLSILTSKWNALEDRLKETDDVKEKLKEKENESLILEFRNVKKVMEESSRWLEKANRRKMDDLFDEMNEKMESLIQGKENVEKLSAELEKNGIDSMNIYDNYVDLVTAFQTFYNDKINEYMKTLEDLMEMLDDNYLRNVLLSLDVDSNMKKFNDLQKTFAKHNEKLQKLSATENFPQLMHIQSRWCELNNLMEGKKKNLMINFELLKLHNENLSAIENQIKAVEHLKNQKFDEDNLELHIQQYQTSNNKFENLSSNLNDSLWKIISVSDLELKDFLTNEVNKISNKIDLLKEHQQDLMNAKKFIVDVNEYLKWLMSIEEESGKVDDVSDTAQLSRARISHSRLKEKIETKNDYFNQLKQAGLELVDKEFEVITKKLKELESRKSEVTEKVQERHRQLEKASQQYGEFKALVAQESDWLDKLERRLRKSPESAADAEDISEELDVRIWRFNAI